MQTTKPNNSRLLMPPQLDPAPFNERTFEEMLASMNKVKLMHPLLPPYLRGVMQAGYCRKNYKIPHHCQGEAMRFAYYIGTGYIMESVNTAKGRLVVGIYGANEIVTDIAFMTGTGAESNLKIIRDSYVLFITREQMEHAYLEIPETEAQTRLTLAAFDKRRLEHSTVRSMAPRDRVLYFYKKYPGLLLHNRLISVDDIASYLGMCRSDLWMYLGRLIREGLLSGEGRKTKARTPD